MSGPLDLISRLKKARVGPHLEDRGLEIYAPKGKLSNELLEVQSDFYF